MGGHTSLRRQRARTGCRALSSQNVVASHCPAGLVDIRIDGSRDCPLRPPLTLAPASSHGLRWHLP